MKSHEDRVQGIHAALPTATSERCGSLCVKMPFGVVFSIYEVGEFAAGYIHRHIGQVNRTVAS